MPPKSCPLDLTNPAVHTLLRTRSIAELAARYGRAPGTIYWWRHRAGITSAEGSGRLTQRKVRALLRHRGARGLTAHELAADTGARYLAAYVMLRRLEATSVGVISLKRRGERRWYLITKK